MTEGAIVLERREGIATITLQRPERLNAFIGRMREALGSAIEEAAGDATTRVVVITGAGRGFCAGADVAALSDLLEQRDAATFRQQVRAGAAVVRAIRRAPQPVVAALNGTAAGAGASLACACDLRLAAERASLGFGFGRLGLHPDWGATHFLPRLVGAGRAAELILSGRTISAQEGERMGLVQSVIPQERFALEVGRMAREIAAGPPLARALVKRNLSAVAAELEAALQAEEEAQLALFRSRDVREGVRAFLEKRPPAFTGKRG